MVRVKRKVQTSAPSMSNRRGNTELEGNRNAPEAHTTRSSAAVQPGKGIELPFRFLDLPAELRNEVYENLMPRPMEMKDRDRDLATFRIPNISRVSRQLRQESLGFIFENRAFDLCVGTNIKHRTTATTAYHRWPPAYDPVKDCGTMGLNPVVRSFLKSAVKWAIFRDVTVNVYDSHDIGSVRYKHDKGGASGQTERIRSHEVEVVDNRVKKSFGSVNFRVAEGKLRIVELHGLARARYRGGLRDNEIDATFADLRRVAEEIAKRSGFKGFTVGDLHHISKALYWRPDVTGGRILN